MFTEFRPLTTQCTLFASAAILIDEQTWNMEASMFDTDSVHSEFLWHKLDAVLTVANFTDLAIVCHSRRTRHTRCQVFQLRIFTKTHHRIIVRSFLYEKANTNEKKTSATLSTVKEHEMHWKQSQTLCWQM